MKQWKSRVIEDEFVCVWADGVNVKVRLAEVIWIVECKALIVKK